MKHLIVIFGGNEIASVTAISLFRSGFAPVLIILENELYLRHNLCFGEALFYEKNQIEDITAELLAPEKLVGNQSLSFPEQLKQAITFTIHDRKIPVINEIPLKEVFDILQPIAIVDLQMHPLEIDLPENIPIVGVYPDRQPGKNCQMAVESRLIHRLGEIYQPGDVLPADSQIDHHFFKNPLVTCPTPLEGIWMSIKTIGDRIRFNEALGKVNDIEIRSPYEGQIWGIAHSGKLVPAKQPIALIYQGPPTENFREFGFQHRAIARGILEAISRLMNTG